MSSSAVRMTLPASAAQLPGQFGWREKPAAELLPTGIRSLDAALSGLPRGAITEITGTVSSGRTSLLLAVLAHASRQGETMALIDAGDCFDPESAAAAGVLLERLLWIRCGGNIPHALRAVDLVAQGGGFGLLALDLGSLPARAAGRIPPASWYRFRNAVENTPAAFVVVDEEPVAKSCAALRLEIRRERVQWTGTPGCSRLLAGTRVLAARVKPPDGRRAAFETLAGGH